MTTVVGIERGAGGGGCGNTKERKKEKLTTREKYGAVRSVIAACSANGAEKVAYFAGRRWGTRSIQILLAFFFHFMCKRVG